MLSQVAGRSGRGEKSGKVIIQCFNTDHYSIICASKHDYKNFYHEEIKIRKKLKYPPYSNLCLIKLVGPSLDLLNKEASKIKDYLEKNLNNVIILGPSLSSMPKIYNKYRL